MKCEYCRQQNDGTYGSGRFCSTKCARAFSTFSKRHEINKKVSLTLKKLKPASPKVELSCKNCLTKFVKPFNKRGSQFCSISCSSTFTQNQPQALTLSSKNRSHYLETHPNHGVSWYDVKCGTSTIKVQGTWEKRVAEWLNENNVQWQRPSLSYRGHRRYTPDFFLPEHDFYIEVKGFWRERDKYKLYLVLDENEVDLRYVDKTNINSLTLDLPKFIERFQRTNIDETKFVNVWI